MKYAIAILTLLLSLALFAQPTDDQLLEVRAELSKLYAYIDSAFEEKRVDDVLRVVHPEATVIRGNFETPFPAVLDQMKEILETGGTVRQRTTITSLTLMGSEATVTRSSDVEVTIGGQTRSGSDVAEDTWVRTPDGWLLRTSVVLGSGEVAPATTPETARQVVADLNHDAHPLDNLAQIAEAIGDARIVALGEATHGTHEIFTAKARIVEYLAKTKGFTVLAVEGNWPEALAVDTYVRTGEGDARGALALLKFWSLNTREMLDLIESMREYNLEASAKLRYTGFDMQFTDGALARVLDFVGRTAPGQLTTVDASYEQVRELGPRRSRSDPRAKAAAEAAREVVELFEKMRDRMATASSDAEWRDAMQAAEIVYQATAFRMEGTSLGYRDEMMARNTEWLLKEVHPEEKMIIWAHNGHVSSEAGIGGEKPMGAWLREKLGEQYYSVGFALAGGEVRAVGPRGLSVYSMPAAPEGSGDRVLALARLPSYFLDMRNVPEGAALRVWLNERHAFYSVGARWNDPIPENNTSVFSMSRSFDGLVFIRDGSASRQPD